MKIKFLTIYMFNYLYADYLIAYIARYFDKAMENDTLYAYETH